MFLKDIKGVAVQIISARTDRKKLLHSLIFKTDSGRENGKKSRFYSGFDFKD